MLFGELFSRYANDYIKNASIKRNKGVFEAKSRLWYGITIIHWHFRAISQYHHSTGHVISQLHSTSAATLCAAFQKYLGTAALIMGWSIAQVAITINTAAVYAYCSDAFPKHQVSQTFKAVLLSESESNCREESEPCEPRTTAGR